MTALDPTSREPSGATSVISAIIATRDRPELLRVAIDSVLAQDHPGPIEVIVVFDQSTPMYDLARTEPQRAVRVVSNTRGPGLAGARNTGIVAADGEYIAFCDDDDAWFPHKLRYQLAAMRSRKAVAAVSGIEVHYGETVRHRVPTVDRITLEDLAHSRMTGAHPSTYLFRRDILLGPVGLVDEAIPSGYGEDYDLLIRTVRYGTVAVVQAPLVAVLWHRGSYFAQRWAAMAEGLGYLLDKHAELRADASGHAWIEGQRAFALAASGDRTGALRSVRRSLLLNPREPRGVLALLVASGIVSAGRIMHALNSRGRGI